MQQHESTVPFRDGFTWYRVTEPDHPRDLAPVFVLHGGPGMAHDYVRNLELLADLTGRTVVHYDQIGCGRSSHHPDAPVDLWTPALFVEEFHSLRAHLGIDRYLVLGQSWGGMLGAEIAVRQPDGILGLLICNSPASMPLWTSEAGRLREELPDAARAALDEHEADGSIDHPDYLAATQVFYERHVCRVVPMPQDFVDSETQMLADPTVYHTMNGPNEFHVVGTMRDWTVIDRLPQVQAPTLVVAGEYDEATPATWQPFLDLIPDAQGHVFPGASHCVHLEQPEEFRRIVADFLAQRP
ncbi:proline iminopeptidase-family hydrolase [Microbacterium sp. 1.5R]|uniref:proline iminopeptidase-family hydrolase n=1 Tax=Microbacterium sp. 1.5R TaxID=1916917 RepID=UPI00119D9C8F|nr:proline iminopeptidase-family hydrolase [Microbacterium sp. 1.5R]